MPAAVFLILIQMATMKGEGEEAELVLLEEVTVTFLREVMEESIMLAMRTLLCSATVRAQ